MSDKLRRLASWGGRIVASALVAVVIMSTVANATDPTIGSHGRLVYNDGGNTIVIDSADFGNAVSIANNYANTTVLANAKAYADEKIAPITAKTATWDAAATAVSNMQSEVDNLKTQVESVQENVSTVETKIVDVSTNPSLYFHFYYAGQLSFNVIYSSTGDDIIETGWIKPVSNDTIIRAKPGTKVYFVSEFTYTDTNIRLTDGTLVQNWDSTLENYSTNCLVFDMPDSDGGFRIDSTASGANSAISWMSAWGGCANMSVSKYWDGTGAATCHTYTFNYAKVTFSSLFGATAYLNDKPVQSGSTQKVYATDTITIYPDVTKAWFAYKQTVQTASSHQAIQHSCSVDTNVYYGTPMFYTYSCFFDSVKKGIVVRLPSDRIDADYDINILCYGIGKNGFRGSLFGCYFYQDPSYEYDRSVNHYIAPYGFNPNTDTLVKVAVSQRLHSNNNTTSLDKASDLTTVCIVSAIE